MSADDWRAVYEIGQGLAPVAGILLAALIICPPDFRSREQRRRDRERRGWRKPSAEQIEGGDHWTSGRIGRQP